jgi:hypothetical protein
MRIALIVVASVTHIAFVASAREVLLALAIIVRSGFCDAGGAMFYGRLLSWVTIASAQHNSHPIGNGQVNSQ